MSWTSQVLIPGLVAFAVTLALTPLVRTLARRFGAVARPRSDRWHDKPTALMGGIAIFAGFAAGFAVIGGEASQQLWLAGGCGAAMFLLGLVDDLVALRPLVKLLAQVIVALVFSLAGIRLVYTFQPALDVPITVFWLVGITNALNLLDNLDGQAAGVCAIASGFLAYFFLSSGQPVEAGIAVVLGAASLGFLVYNWNPASIFMGDSGSLLLGFVLAAVTLFNQTHRTRNLLATLAVPLLVLLVPILDTTLVTLARKAHGRAVSQGGTDHISHRLVALGLSERQTVLLIYGVTLLSGLMAIFVRHLSPVMALAVFPLFLGALLFGLMVLGRVRVYASQRRSDQTRDEAPEGGAEAAALAPTDSIAGDDAEGRRVMEGKEAAGAAPLVAMLSVAQRHQLLLLVFDGLAVLFCYYLAFLLRFGSTPAQFLRAFLSSLPVVVPVQLGVLWLTGQYRTLWRYSGLGDLGRLALAVLLAVAGSVALATFLFRFELFSRAVFAADAVLLFVALAIGRFMSRASRLVSRQQDRRAARRTLIYGAGDAGLTAVRELRESDRWALWPVGLLDDDRRKAGRSAHGLRVLGRLEDLTAVAAAQRAEVLLVTIQDLPAERWAELGRLAKEAGVSVEHLELTIEPVDPARRGQSGAAAPAGRPSKDEPAP